MRGIDVSEFDSFQEAIDGNEIFRAFVAHMEENEHYEALAQLKKAFK